MRRDIAQSATQEDPASFRPCTEKKLDIGRDLRNSLHFARKFYWLVDNFTFLIIILLFHWIKFTELYFICYSELKYPLHHIKVAKW